MTGGQQYIHEGAMVALRSVHGKYLSAQPDGRAMWDRPWSSTWEYFNVERRQNGKITLKGAHGMYLSAQLDGSVQINRGAAPPSGWEEFTVEDRGNNVVCLRSCHGKYLSAQQDGTAQWNRDHAPRGGWEDIQFVQQDGTDQAARGQKQPATNNAGTQPPDVTASKSKRTNVKIAMVVGICLLILGLPLLIIGSISTGEDNLAMLIPGAVMFGIGAFVTVVAAAIGMGFGKRATISEQDPVSNNWWEGQSE